MSAASARGAVPASGVVVPPAHDGFWCECVVFSRDHTREWLISGYRAPSPRVATRWVAQQAVHLADLIDPAPQSRWVPVGALRRVDQGPAAAQSLDPVAALRRWPHDSGERDRALEAMRDGSLYTFSVGDDRLRYRLSARPLFTSPRRTPPDAAVP